MDYLSAPDVIISICRRPFNKTPSEQCRPYIVDILKGKIDFLQQYLQQQRDYLEKVSIFSVRFTEDCLTRKFIYFHRIGAITSSGTATGQYSSDHRETGERFLENGQSGGVVSVEFRDHG